MRVPPASGGGAPPRPEGTANAITGGVQGGAVIQTNSFHGDVTVTAASPPWAGLAATSDEPVLIAQADPAALQVHAAVLPAPDPGGYGFLTPSLPRAHDTRLRDHLVPALDGRRSVLVMLTGDSSTGKTRALYEALRELAPDRMLLRPRTAEDLLRLLGENRVDDRSVLWLNEAQRFFHGPASSRAAAALHQLLPCREGIVAVGTLWTRPYWEELTRPGTPQDRHAQVRELLKGPATAHVQVLGRLLPAEQEEWARLAGARGDRRMRDALEAGAGDRGRVVQHLSGARTPGRLRLRPPDPLHPGRARPDHRCGGRAPPGPPLPAPGRSAGPGRRRRTRPPRTPHRSRLGRCRPDRAVHG